MTQPAVGTDWIGAGLNDRGPEFLRRGNPVAVLVRDARGAATDISPHNSDGSVRWSPFAQDNTWRDDLLAIKKLNGSYVTNTDANEGFINLGAFKDGDGPAWKPKITSDHFMIVQDNFPYDSNLTEEAEIFSLTPVDTASPWVQRLRNNRPFSDSSGNSLMEDPGATDAGFSRLLNGQNPGRQFLFVRERMWDGLPIYSVQGVSLARWEDVGNSKYDKKDSEASELSYIPLPDGRFMAMQDGSYQPILVHTWWGGAGWTALGGLPVWPGAAPLATQTGATTATVSLEDPTGTGDPFAVTWESSVSPHTVWVAATAGTPVADTPSAGHTQYPITGLTTATQYKLRATAEGTNGATAVSAVSNTITTA